MKILFDFFHTTTNYTNTNQNDIRGDIIFVLVEYFIEVLFYYIARNPPPRIMISNNFNKTIQSNLIFSGDKFRSSETNSFKINKTRILMSPIAVIKVHR